MLTNLPLELLTEVFKNIRNNYETLYSCILVNKQWHTINISNLWKNPFYSEGSTKILIKCLFVEDKDYYSTTKIKLNFKLLEKSPLYNYAKFMTELDFVIMGANLSGLLYDRNEFHWLEKKLTKFVLDYSIAIKKLVTFEPEYKFLKIDYNRFNIRFKNLYEFHYNSANTMNSNNSCDFLDKLSSICRNIQVLKLRFQYFSDTNSLAQLIKVQHKIKELVIDVDDTSILSENFKKAISIHSKSIIYYEINEGKNLESLIPAFQNLETLILYDNPLISYFNNSCTISNIKSISLPKLQVLNIALCKQLFFLDLSDFIKINGKNLKNLSILGSKVEDLGILIESIGHNCKNLEYLEIIYDNEVNQELTCIFNNCTKLVNITLITDGIMDGDKIFKVLSQILPKNLNTIRFDTDEFTFSNDALRILNKSWKDSRSLKIITFKNGTEYDIFQDL
jgi:hypothetical protein